MGAFLQYDPEFRRVSLGDAEDRTVTPRFSALGVAFPVKSRGMLGLSTHSFLDRTWTTTIRSGERLGPDSVLFTETSGSSGAINDSRLTFAYLFGSKVSVGAAVHVHHRGARLVRPAALLADLLGGVGDGGALLLRGDRAGDGADDDALIAECHGRLPPR